MINTNFYGQIKPLELPEYVSVEVGGRRNHAETCVITISALNGEQLEALVRQFKVDLFARTGAEYPPTAEHPSVEEAKQLRRANEELERALTEASGTLDQLRKHQAEVIEESREQQQALAKRVDEAERLLREKQAALEKQIPGVPSDVRLQTLLDRIAEALDLATIPIAGECTDDQLHDWVLEQFRDHHCSAQT